MRFWLSGPRMLDGLVRPGISFDVRELFGTRRHMGQSAVGGYCYVIRGEHGYVKIGSSISPIRRLSQLQTGSPYALSIVNTVPVAYDAAQIEFAAHELLDRHRVNGEWFAVTPEIAMAAIYAAADRVGRSTTQPIRATREPILRPFGWFIVAVIVLAIIGHNLPERASTQSADTGTNSIDSAADTAAWNAAAARNRFAFKPHNVIQSPQGH